MGVVASAVLLRHLGVYDSGRYASIIALVTIVGGVSDLGITQLGIRELAVAPRANRPQVARELLGLRYLLTLGGLAVMLAFAAVAYQPVILVGAAIAGFGLLMQVTADNYTLSLQVELRFGWLSLLDLCRSFVAVVLTIALAAAGGRMVAFSAIPVGTGAALLIVSAMIVRNSRALGLSLALPRLVRLMREAAPYAMASVAATLHPRAAVVVLHLLSNGQQLGLYAASVRVIEGLTGVPILLIGTVLPIFFRAAYEDSNRFDYAVSRVLGVSIVLCAGAALSLGVGAPVAITIIAGQRFHAADSVLALQGIGFGFSFVTSLWGNVLLSQRRHRELVWLNVLALIGLLGLLIVLTPGHGADGAAIAMSAVDAVAAILGVLLVCRAGRVRLSGGSVIVKVAVAAGGGFACQAIAGGGHLVRLMVALAVYSVVVLLTRALPGEVWTGLLRSDRAVGA